MSTPATHHVYVPWSGGSYDVCAEHRCEVVSGFGLEEVTPAEPGTVCEYCAEDEAEAAGSEEP